MRFSRHLIGSLAAAAILAPSLVSADATAPKWYDKLSVGGYADASYQLWLTQPSAFGGNTSIPYRSFDGTPNAVDYTGELTLAYKDDASKTSSNIDLLYGNIGNNAWGSALTIGNAYITQGLGAFSLDIGKFPTPIGYETWNLTANANISRGLLYFQEPLFHTGAKLSFSGPAGLGAWVLYDDGQNVDIYNNSKQNNGNGYGAGLTYAGKSLTANLSYYLDGESHNTNVMYNGLNWTYQMENQDLIDFTTTYTLNDSLNFGGEYLYNTIIDSSPSAPYYSPKTQSYALYSTYNTPVQNLSVSGRFEQVDSPDLGTTTNSVVGATPSLNSLVVDSYTLTVKYVNGPVTNVLEYRSDASNDFVNNTNNNKSDKFSQTNQTLSFNVIYGF